MATSGRAVVFAGFTVMISVLGMLLIGLSFLQGLAVGTSLAVVVAVLAAITLLPALLGFVGFTIDRLHVGRRTPSGRKACGTAGRASCSAGRPPLRSPVSCVLVVAAVPTFRLRLGSADASNDPTSSTTHRAYDLIAEGFGPGANGPILVVADTTAPGSRAALPHLVAAPARRSRRAVGERGAAQRSRHRRARDADPTIGAAGRGHQGARSRPPPPRRAERGRRAPD